MTGRVFNHRYLINADFRPVFFLTLALFLILATRLSHADPLPPAEAEQQRQQIDQARNYLRTQGLHTLSLLPSEVHQVMGWFSGDWHAMQFSPGSDDTAGLPTPNFVDQQPVADNAVNPFGLSGHIHHKGFLPTHDAMLMGIDLKKNLFDNKLALTARPFYGQSWHSLGNYYGGEIAMNIDQRPDGLPWGKIAMGYVGGQDQLTDHGSGVELHGDVDLTNGFQFTSGIRQNNSTGDANYLMVKWKMNLD